MESVPLVSYGLSFCSSCNMKTDISTSVNLARDRADVRHPEHYGPQGHATEAKFIILAAQGMGKLCISIV